MPSREEQYEQRKYQILLIALNEFVDKGYYGTSTREIAKIAGISSGLLFHYFDSKQSLYEALIEIGCEKMSFEYTEGDSPIAALRQVVENVFQLISEKSFAAKMFLLMGDASYSASKISPKAGEMLAKHDVIRLSIPLFIKGQELGEIRKGNPLVLSIAFWSSIQGIAEAVALQEKVLIPEVDWIMDIIQNNTDKQ